MRHSRLPVALLLGAALVSALPVAAAGQQRDTRINVYRYILDVDVPESPGLQALDLTPLRVLRASAPKPVAAQLMFGATGAHSISAVAFDAAPYYLAGGGVRELDSFRSNTVRGRLLRVLTKTLASVAVARDDAQAGSLLLGVGLRSTIHDPHDPVLNWGLADSVYARFAAAGLAPVAVADEDLGSRGVELDDLFRRARRAVRERCCMQIALGWAADMTARGGVLEADSMSRLRHQLVVGLQFTAGPRYDILAGLRLMDVAGAGRVATGAGVQRKGTHVDVRAELFYDDGVLPSLGIESHLLPALLAGASLGTRRGTDELMLRTHLSWYQASRH